MDFVWSFIGWLLRIMQPLWEKAEPFFVWNSTSSLGTTISDTVWMFPAIETVHILAMASIRGLIVRGPVADRDQAFVLVRDWLGAPPTAISREAALGELARRYLAGHAPAADRDLAQWAGIGLRDARLGLARCGAIQRADRLAELPSNPRRAAAALPPPRLLGAFEPLLLGWASRDPILGAHRRIVTVNGLFRPFALASGRAVATWNIAGGQVVLAPFAPLAAQTQAALAADAAAVMRFLGQ